MPATRLLKKAKDFALYHNDHEFALELDLFLAIYVTPTNPTFEVNAAYAEAQYEVEVPTQFLTVPEREDWNCSEVIKRPLDAAQDIASRKETNHEFLRLSH